MGKAHKPRSGSLQVWPRKRAKRAYARIRAWATRNDAKPLGFAGYKVGMGHVTYTQTRSVSPNKGRIESKPVTIIECPPLKVMAVAYYKNTTYGVKKVAEVRADSQDKHFIRKLLPTKNKKEELRKYKSSEKNFRKDWRKILNLSFKVEPQLTQKWLHVFMTKYGML